MNIDTIMKFIISLLKNKKIRYNYLGGTMRKKYLLKQIIKYSFLIIILIVATIFVYKTGKNEYKKYLENHKNDKKWIEDNINLVEDIRIGTGVYTVNMPNDLEIDKNIYNKEISQEINKLLINNYKIEEPLFIYDPFKLDNTSINVYFHTGEKYKFEYYITTNSITNEPEKFQYTRATNEDGSDILNNKHFYVLKGLKPGSKNNLIIRILNDNNELVDSQNFIINVPK